MTKPSPLPIVAFCAPQQSQEWTVRLQKLPVHQVATIKVFASYQELEESLQVVAQNWGGIFCYLETNMLEQIAWLRSCKAHHPQLPIIVIATAAQAPMLEPITSDWADDIIYTPYSDACMQTKIAIMLVSRSC